MSVYEIITEKILQKLQEGTAPWTRPWNGGEMPKNLITGKEYRGINLFLLNMAGYANPYWLTFKQCKEKGGYVRAGEKSTQVVYWNISDLEDSETGDKKKVPLLRYYNVFNTGQCEGLKIPAIEGMANEFSPLDKCERLINGMPQRPAIKHKEPRAFYVPAFDYVNMPKQESFTSPEGYYSTLFHELTHSTSHSSRLNRTGITTVNSYGSKDYGKEELIAEMGASFLSGIAGIENKTIDNSAAYLQSWIKTIREDKKVIIAAAAAAQKAVDYITGHKAPESGE